MNMREMRHLIGIVETGHVPLVEMRVAAWSGATITVLHNPSRIAFENFTKRHEVLRGLLSDDGSDLYLWPAHAAVHPNMMQELGLGQLNCIFYVRGHWKGPNLHDPNGLYQPAIQRITPKQLPKWRDEDDELLRKIFDEL